MLGGGRQAVVGKWGRVPDGGDWPKKQKKNDPRYMISDIKCKCEHLWHDKGENVGCWKYWFLVTGLKVQEVINSYVLHCFEFEELFILCNKMSVWNGDWIKM